MHPFLQLESVSGVFHFTLSGVGKKLEIESKSRSPRKHRILAQAVVVRGS